jgi:hypothetical protein
MHAHVQAIIFYSERRVTTTSNCQTQRSISKNCAQLLSRNDYRSVEDEHDILWQIDANVDSTSAHLLPVIYVLN